MESNGPTRSGREPHPVPEEAPRSDGAPVEPPRKGRFPDHVVFLGLNLGVGIGFGIAFAALMVLTNAGGLKDLISGSADPMLPVLMFYFMCALTGGSLMMGIAIMTMPYDKRGPGAGPRA